MPTIIMLIENKIIDLLNVLATTTTTTKETDKLILFCHIFHIWLGIVLIIEECHH